MRAIIAAALALAWFAAPAAAQDVDGQLAAGDSARCHRNPDKALTHYRAALAIDSMHYDALWKTSQAWVDIGKMLPDAQRARRDSMYATGMELARRAVAVNSTGADGHFMIAVATGRFALTKSPGARVRFAGVVREEAIRAVELNPRHDGALHVLGRWNAEIQRLPGLTRFFARTFLGASIFNQASWDNAINNYTQAIAIAPANIYHYLDLAEALVDADRPVEAVAHLKVVATLAPGCDPMDAVYQQQAAALLQRISR